jgi:alkylation response protein AidB-like acyl-CoA dehydrogenase
MTTITKPADMIATARELRPKIEAFADEAERLGRLPDGLAALLRDARVFGMARAPQRHGLGLDPVATMRVVEEISIADASTGWCAAIGSGSIEGALRFNDAAAREIFRPGTCMAGVGAPNGRAVPLDGGYRVSGRWPYASGCHHSDWIFAGSLVIEGDKPRMNGAMPEYRLVLMPMSEVTILDTWQVSGLRGTGSNDVEVNDAFVPEERTTRLALADGALNSDGIPMYTLFGVALVPVALGAARRAIDEIVDMAHGKTPLLSASKLSEKPVVQHEIARAEGMLQAASAFIYDTVEGLVAAATRGEAVDMATRAKVKLACTHAVSAAADATAIAYRLGGGQANYERSVLQRCLRDVNAVTQHFVVAPNNFETVGRVMMGLEPGTFML